MDKTTREQINCNYLEEKYFPQILFISYHCIFRIDLLGSSHRSVYKNILFGNLYNYTFESINNK